LKTELRVRQGHWKHHHSIQRIWLPVNVSQQSWAYLIMFPRQTAISVENRKIFPPPCILCSCWRGSPWNWDRRWVSKTRMIGQPGRQRSLKISSAVWIECTNVTDGHHVTAKTALTHSHVGFYCFITLEKWTSVHDFSLLNRPELTKFAEAAGHCSGNMNLYGSLPRNPGRWYPAYPAAFWLTWMQSCTLNAYYFSQGWAAAALRGSRSYNSNFLHRSLTSLTVKKSRTLVQFFQSYHKNTNVLLFCEIRDRIERNNSGTDTDDL